MILIKIKMITCGRPFALKKKEEENDDEQLGICTIL